MLKKHLARALMVLLATAALGCGATHDGEPVESESRDETPGTIAQPGITVGTDAAVFQTEPFTLDPGEERFLCYAATTSEDLVVSGYRHGGHAALHHVIFSRATEPEPEGFSECDTLFKLSWDPLYLSGAGRSEIAFPEGTGHVLPAESQLVVQLHLLNTSTESVNESVGIEMVRSTADDPRPIGNYAFGEFDINIPPASPGTVEGVCEIDEPVQLVAAFPHMHLMGRALTFETGPSEDELTEVYRRDPYDFDDQSLELLHLSLKPGDVTRVTCNYENTLDQALTFGESTTSEMCFLVGFAVDREGISGCFAAREEASGDE